MKLKYTAKTEKKQGESMAITNCYIDGFNLYHAIAALDKPHLKWLDLRALASSLVHKTDTLGKVYYFTAHHMSDPQKLSRHRRYIDALKAVDVDIVLSRFQRTDKACAKTGNSCHFFEEKETDVVFALTAMRDAYKAQMGRAIFITADSDQVPTIKMLREDFPSIHIDLWLPPNRGSVGKTLGKHATNSNALSWERIESCIFPRTVYKPDGKMAATCPTEYQHPKAT